VVVFSIAETTSNAGFALGVIVARLFHRTVARQSRDTLGSNSWNAVEVTHEINGFVHCFHASGGRHSRSFTPECRTRQSRENSPTDSRQEHVV